MLAGGRFVAFDAKSLRRPAPTWKPDARQLHQLTYLRQTAALGGLAFYLVRNGMDEARIVLPAAVSESVSVDLSTCPLLRRALQQHPLGLAAGGAGHVGRPSWPPHHQTIGHHARPTA